MCVLVHCTGQALGPSPAHGPGRAWAYILRARIGPGLKFFKHRAWAGPGPSVSGPGRAWAGPGNNKNINTKPRLVILLLIKTDYKL